VELRARFDYDALTDRDSSIEAIDFLAARWKVSSRLLAFRLLRESAINRQQFEQLGKFFFERWEARRTKQKAKSRGSEGGPSYYVLKRHRVGAALLDASERLLRSGELSTTRAATVLGVRALKVEKMFTEPRLV
jgi:hypothetical protein